MGIRFLSPLSAPQRRTLWRALALAAVLHLAALVYTVQWGQPLLRDSDEYVRQGHNLLAEGSWYCGPDDAPYHPQYETRRPPLYGVLLAGSMALGMGFWGVIVLQNLLSLWNIALVLRLLFGLGLKVRWWTVGVALVLAPAQIIYANAVMTELVFQSLLLLMVAAALLYIQAAKRGEKPPVRYVWWGTLAVALLALTKPVMYLFVGPLVMLMGVFFWRNRLPQWHLVPLVLPVAAVAGLMAYNQHTTGYAHVSSIQTFNLWNYNVYQVLRATMPPAQADSLSDAVWDAAVANPNFAVAMKRVDSASTAVLKRELGTYLGLHMRGIVHFVIDPGRFDVYQFLDWPQPEGKGLLLQATAQGGYGGAMQALSAVPWPVLGYLGLVAAAHGLLAVFALLALLSGRVSWAWVLFVLICVGYLAFLTGPLGASRFRLPAEPLLWLLLPLGAEAALDWLSRVRRLRA